MDNELSFNATFKKKADSAIISLKKRINEISVGKYTPVIFKNIKIDYYGEYMPITNLASIKSSEDSLVIVPYDKSFVNDISVAIQKSNLHVMPTIREDSIYIKFQTVTQERRDESIKDLRENIEHGKNALKILRRDIISSIKSTQDLSKEQIFDLEKNLKNIYQRYIDQINEIYNLKHKELLNE